MVRERREKYNIVGTAHLYTLTHRGEIVKRDWGGSLWFWGREPSLSAWWYIRVRGHHIAKEPSCVCRWKQELQQGKLGEACAGCVFAYSYICQIKKRDKKPSGGGWWASAPVSSGILRRRIVVHIRACVCVCCVFNVIIFNITTTTIHPDSASSECV